MNSCALGESELMLDSVRRGRQQEVDAVHEGPGGPKLMNRMTFDLCSLCCLLSGDRCSVSRCGSLECEVILML